MKAFSASAAILRLNLPRCNWVTGQVNGSEHTGSAVYQWVFPFVAHTDRCANRSLAGSTSRLVAFSLADPQPPAFGCALDSLREPCARTVSLSSPPETFACLGRFRHQSVERQRSTSFAG